MFKQLFTLYFLQTQPKKAKPYILKRGQYFVTGMQRSWIFLLLLASSWLLPIASGQEDPLKSCFCQLEGVLEDCPCEAATVDAFNQKIHQQLSPLLHHPYFRYFQVCMQSILS